MGWALFCATIYIKVSRAKRASFCYVLVGLAMAVSSRRNDNMGVCKVVAINVPHGSH